MGSFSENFRESYAETQRALTREKFGNKPASTPKEPPRPLTSIDVGTFEDAIAERDTHRRVPVRTVNAFRDDLIRRRPWRMRRLAKDLDWLRKQADKYGIEREEIKWML
jgi:hypothetical protein